MALQPVAQWSEPSSVGSVTMLLQYFKQDSVTGDYTLFIDEPPELDERAVFAKYGADYRLIGSPYIPDALIAAELGDSLYLLPIL